MTSQNLIITKLMSDLVKRNGSDLHLTGDKIPYFRIQGSILPASESVYKQENLISDLKILKTSPDHPDAHHNMAILEKTDNQLNAAKSHFKLALKSNPNVRQYWLSYLDFLIELGTKDSNWDLHYMIRF